MKRTPKTGYRGNSVTGPSIVAIKENTPARPPRPLAYPKARRNRRLGLRTAVNVGDYLHKNAREKQHFASRGYYSR
jgi:hypothetical protein